MGKYEVESPQGGWAPYTVARYRKALFGGVTGAVGAVGGLLAGGSTDWKALLPAAVAGFAFGTGLVATPSNASA